MREIITDTNGVKTQEGICIYIPSLDIWVLDEYGNLLKINEFLRKIKTFEKKIEELTKRMDGDLLR